MKRIAILAAVLMVSSLVNAQFVVGIQGGYHQQTFDNPNYILHFTTPSPGRDTTTIYSLSQSNIVAGLQLGYQITPKLYVGVMGGIVMQNSRENFSHDSIFIDQRAHSAYVGMILPVVDHAYTTERSGWSVTPMVRYEFARYGNMHLNLMLQGNITSMGYTTGKESYTKPFERNELEDFDAVSDSISNFSWSVSLRPTLTYEFSRHLSAELSLDFLSIGYISNSVKHEAGGEAKAYSETTTTIYAGLNTFMETLRWESPMLRLGFNYTF